MPRKHNPNDLTGRNERAVERRAKAREAKLFRKIVKLSKRIDDLERWRVDSRLWLEQQERKRK